jgi:hypothetical protein
MSLRRKMAILAVPVVLALAGGAVLVHAASSPSPNSPAGTQKQAGEEGQTGEVDTAGDVGQQGPADQAGDQGQQGPGDQSGQTGDQGQTGELDQANETK